MMGILNPERFQEAMGIMAKYKDPTTNFLDANNPDYLAEIAALDQKYAPAQTQQAPVQTQQAPAQTQTQQAPTQTQQASASDKAPTMLYGSDYSLENYVGGQPETLNYIGSDGRGYSYRYAEDEYVGDNRPPDGVDLTLRSVTVGGKEKGDYFNVNIDPSEVQYGGKMTPQAADAYAKEKAREPGYESGGGGLFYEYNGREYYTPDNSGQGIPVGSTNITRDPNQLGSYDAEGNYTEKDPSTYTSPVLSKGFTQYHDQVTDQSSFKSDVQPPSKDLTFGNVFSINPYGAVIDTGLKNPFGEGNIEFSNPPSQLHNLGPFFNQAEAFGYENYKKQFDDDPSYLENLFGVQPVPKSVGEMIKDTGGTSVGPPSSDPDPGSSDDDDNGGGGGGGGGGDDSTTPPKFAFAPPMKSAPISTAPDEPINTDPRFQPIFPQQPIQPTDPIEGGPVEGLFPIPTQPQASPAMPQPQPIPIEAQPAVMPPPQVGLPVMPPPTFADVMAQGGTQGQAGINPYFQAIEQLNASSPYSPIMGMKNGGGIMSLQNRMLMDPASRAMSQGIMS